MTTGLTIDDPTYFDRLEEVETRHWWSLGLWRLTTHWLDRALRTQRGLTALDIGCGAGVTASRLRARAEIETILGLDPSRFALSRASKRSLDGLSLGSALSLPFEAESIDLATCFDVFQHLPPGGDRRASAEIHRVLRPGGFALIRSNGRGGWNGRSADSPYHLDQLAEVIAGSGLQIVRSTYVNCLPALASELLGFLRGGSRLSGHPSGGGLKIAVPNPIVNRAMASVASLEAIAAGALGMRLPFGHSTMILATKRAPSGTTVEARSGSGFTESPQNGLIAARGT